MKETIELTTIIPAPPKTIFEAWLNSEMHTNMTGGEAHCASQQGERFTAWDGYIEGKNSKLEPFREIVQSWRTSEFSETDKDSRLVIQLEPETNGTKLTSIQTNIPEGQTQYIQGWKEHYFEPMKTYFNNQ